MLDSRFGNEWTHARFVNRKNGLASLRENLISTAISVTMHMTMLLMVSILRSMTIKNTMFVKTGSRIILIHILRGM